MDSTQCILRLYLFSLAIQSICNIACFLLNFTMVRAVCDRVIIYSFEWLTLVLVELYSFALLFPLCAFVLDIFVCVYWNGCKYDGLFSITAGARQELG